MSLGLHNRLNIGQLAKEKSGKEVLSLGRATYAGTVAAAREWGGDLQIMEMSPALEDSYESLAH
jgi:erythromycin esterase-like protein